MGKVDRLGREKDFHQRAVSRRRHRHEFPFSVGGEGQAGFDIFWFKIRKIRENLLLGHACSEILSHVIHRNPKPSYAGLPPPPRLPGSIVMRSRHVMLSSLGGPLFLVNEKL